MPKLKDNQVPSYRLHKQSGPAVVTLSGRDHLLGTHGTPASRAEYDRVIAEWLAQGRRGDYRCADGVTVSRVIAEFWAHAKAYYAESEDSGSGGEAENFRLALIPLRRLYGGTPAAGFGPRALAAVQQEMVRLGWARTHVNRQLARVKQVFKWAVAQEMVPPSVHHGLTAVAGLRKGKSAVRESETVQPVPDAWVEQTLPHLAAPVCAMIRLQLLTGMRPGEVVLMRGCDLDTTGPVWVYRPQRHKTEHHGHGREIRIGPKAQTVVAPFLTTDVAAHLFGAGAPALQNVEPSEEVCRRSEVARVAGRPCGPRYTVRTYRRAIARACDAAFPPSPELSRLRVAAGGRKRARWELTSEWRARLGAERWDEVKRWRAERAGALTNFVTRPRRDCGVTSDSRPRVILGHRSAAVTQIYAEVDQGKATRIMADVG